MLYKSIDDKRKEIALLNNLLKSCKNQKQKPLILKDLTLLKNGYEAEKNNAYYLDFAFKNSKHVLLLHDIRIEYNSRVAQIDHLLINRFGVEILESKSFTGKLTINLDGSLTVNYGKYTKTFPNPIEQNNRHEKVLAELINDKINLPSNISFFGGISISSKVLIHPETMVANKKLPEGYERADSFTTNRNKEIDNMGTISVFKTAGKFMTIEKAKEIADFLIKNHKPTKIDYAKKYHIKQTITKTNQVKPMQAYIKEAVLSKNMDICKETREGEFLCSKCKSPNLEIRAGYNYYFKCLFCGENTSIKLTCTTEKCKPKLKKRGLNFYKVCDICGKDELFFTNKPQK